MWKLGQCYNVIQYFFSLKVVLTRTQGASHKESRKVSRDKDRTFHCGPEVAPQRG